MCDCQQQTTFNADDFDYSDFGIIKVGKFDSDGNPTGFEVDCDKLSDRLPRFIKREPVMELLLDKSKSVYLRGLYSKNLTDKRLAAF